MINRIPFKPNYKLLFILLLGHLFFSCNVVKRVKDSEHLLTKNTIEVDGKITKNERINNIPLQKPNSGMNGILGVPLKLHVYNLARPNIDSILQEKIYNDASKVRRKTRVLSRKQLDKSIASHIKFNTWLKKTGEAPTILDQDKTEKTRKRLESYFYKRGWLYNTVDYEIKKDSNKRVKVLYKVTKNDPSILDSLKVTIKTPIVDTLYQKHKNESLFKNRSAV